MVPSLQRWRKSSTATRTCNIPADCKSGSCASNGFIACGTSSISLLEQIPESDRNSAFAVKNFQAMICQTRMHVVTSPRSATSIERPTPKDIDFTPQRYQAALGCGLRAYEIEFLSRMPWVGEFDPLSGVSRLP